MYFLKNPKKTVSFKYLLVHLKTEKGNLAVKADVPIMINISQ